MPVYPPWIAQTIVRRAVTLANANRNPFAYAYGTEAKRRMSSSVVSPQAVSLRHVLAGARFIGAADICAWRVACDTRTCRAGDVFVALSGPEFDGHNFIAAAIERGASAIVAERAFECGVPCCVVADTREAFGQICHALAGRPSQSLKVIGVTGTNGKTTTSHLIASILHAAGRPCGWMGTLGWSDAADEGPAALTTPAAHELADWLRRTRQNGCGYAVLEVSSHAVHQRRIAGIEFAAIALTNLRRDHLDYHRSVAEYHRAKTELFQYLMPGGVAVINADDPASRACAPLIPGGVLSFGLQRPADITATLVERFKSKQTFLLTAGDAVVPVRTAIIGDHHIQNCLAATAVALAEGIDLAAIAGGLEAVRCVPGRLERIECGQPFGVFVDFAHTADALTSVLAALRQVTAGKLLCVFGAGGNRDAQKRPRMGRAVEDLADVAIVTTDNPRREQPSAIAAEILAGMQRPTDARWVPDRREAIHYALGLAGPDDVVLIAGRGHETHQIVGDERIALDDRGVARRWLYNRKPGSPYGALMSVANC